MPLEEMLQAMQNAKKFLYEQLEQKITSEKPSESQISNSSEQNNNQIGQIAENQFETTNFHKNIHIFSHLDADGLSAAAILVRTFKKAKIGFQVTILRQLETDYIQQIQDEIKKYKHFIIFADFGTGQYDFLDKSLNNKDYLILDHHSPLKSDLSPSVNHVNPYFYGIDGSYEISGAGVCFYFAITMDPTNIDMAWIPLCGSIGDMQNKGEKGTFIGLNAKILEEAIKSGKIQIETDIAIARNRSLIHAIAYTLPENVPGLSNNEMAAKAFLESINVKPTNELNEPRTLVDLTQLEKKSLNNALLQFALTQKQMGLDFVKKIVSTVYSLKALDPKFQITDIREMSSLLNGCGRMGRPSIGIAALLGDNGALQEALEESHKYRKKIAEALEWANSHMVQHENIITFYGGNVIDEKIIGTIASMLIRSNSNHPKPIIAYAESDAENFKVSARATEKMTQNGLDLSEIMRQVCQKIGIENPAGGHPPAAGARIPSKRLKEFLDAINEAVKNVNDKK